jgi:hypothetical protein
MGLRITASSLLLELQRRAFLEHAHRFQVQRAAAELAAADEVVPDVPADDDVRAVALPRADRLALDLGVGFEAAETLESPLTKLCGSRATPCDACADCIGARGGAMANNSFAPPCPHRR